MGEPAKPAYGGQAVLEGVMMRGRSRWAVAVRRPDGRIWVESHPVQSLGDRYRVFKLPFVRGISVLADAMKIGSRCMAISTNQSVPEEDRLNRKEFGGSIVFAAVLFIGIFIVLPNVLSNVTFGGRPQTTATAAAKEAVIRLAIFVGYLLLLSAFSEVRRIFQYHGAEHQTIHAHEHGERWLTPDAVMRYPTAHVRCGTNFLILTVLMTIVAYSLLGRPALWIQITQRIAGIFVIAAISYEFLRLGATKSDRPLVRALMRPGLWLQRITTKQPTPDMVEVAVRSFERILPEDERGSIPRYTSDIVDGDER